MRVFQFTGHIPLVYFERAEFCDFSVSIQKKVQKSEGNYKSTGMLPNISSTTKFFLFFFFFKLSRLHRGPKYFLVLSGRRLFFFFFLK